MRKKIGTIVVNAILLLMGLVTVYPFVWMVFSSFKKNSEIMALEQQLLPKEFIIDKNNDFPNRRGLVYKVT